METYFKTVFPINREYRKKLNLPDTRFEKEGCLIIRNQRDARELAEIYSNFVSDSPPSAADFYGAACIIAAWRYLLELYSTGKESYNHGVFQILTEISSTPEELLIGVKQTFSNEKNLGKPIQNERDALLIHWTLVRMANENPAFDPFKELFKSSDDISTSESSKLSRKTWEHVKVADKSYPGREPENKPPITTLYQPIYAAPNSIKGQLLYILEHWKTILGKQILGIISALDMAEEENRPRFTGPGPSRAFNFSETEGTARFSLDDDWMPGVVLIAKNTMVWLDQLSKRYHRSIQRLSEIPDEELDSMAAQGFNALWLIGLWERSPASREIKQRMGNHEAAASAYSLFGYDIAANMGGWEALENLRMRADARGIRLSSDMVPNHVGLDSDWVRNHPDWLLSSSECPFPSYTFNGDNLSHNQRVETRIEDHYWNKSDAAVVFQRKDTATGDIRYVFHGNDGTVMPWNDTAQIDFLNPEAREAVVQDILHVASNFPIIRFDAAMVLAKKHIRRLWYPAPRDGGAIPSRSEKSLSDEEFHRAIPHEFWREIVDRMATEKPGTLLLAEAFWMMEGYFVRSLGMHRVYNSAFMNMLRDQKNKEYRDMMKETLMFDPGILQRFVNFMNNPDEETAAEQFGSTDKYFSVCTLLSTLPGLPMFGHGQIEGLSEKYGMEYTRAYKEEHPNSDFIARHEREIFPLLRRRFLFSGVEHFRLYDVIASDTGRINENIFAYTNSKNSERTLVVVNNAYERVSGGIHHAVPEAEQKKLPLLSDALIPKESENNDWFLLRENISNLWYIRSVGELRKKGLHISINGYGREVFFEFRLEKKRDDNLWASLAEDLSGRGMNNPDAMLNELRLRPVRTLLDNLIPPGLIEKLALSIEKGQVPVWPKENSEILLLLENLYQHFPNKNHGRVPRNSLMDIQRRLKNAAKLWKFFGGGIRRSLNRLYKDIEKDDARFLVTWILLESACSLDNWDSWNLNYWYEQRKEAGVLPVPAENILAILTAGAWWTKSRNPNLVIVDLLTKEHIRKVCGVNLWEGTLWYKKEGWTVFLRMIFLSAATETGSGWRLRRFLRKWNRRHRRADYRIDKLL